MVIGRSAFRSVSLFVPWALDPDRTAEAAISSERNRSASARR